MDSSSGASSLSRRAPLNTNYGLPVDSDTSVFSIDAKAKSEAGGGMESEESPTSEEDSDESEAEDQGLRACSGAG